MKRFNKVQREYFPFCNFKGAKMFKYPTRIGQGPLTEKPHYTLKNYGIKLDYKTGEFTVEGITGRINRNGGIIELHVPTISAEHEYLIQQRFRGRDYRIAIPSIADWKDRYESEEAFV